ncbi:DNA polymerase III subunit alpha [Bacteriovoracaceae bacterium]|nr:DNA polymerase III subunit alpha [Bacteriovoracaceae bacterium]
MKLIAESDFCYFHVHSSFSPMGGLLSPFEICEMVKSDGMNSVAVTETNGFYSLIHFQNAAAELGLQLFIGVELVYENWRVIVFPTSLEGYQNTCCLVSKITQMTFAEEREFLNSFNELLAGHALFITDKKDFFEVFQGQDLIIQNTYFEASPLLFSAADFNWCEKNKIPAVVTSRLRYEKEEDAIFYRYLKAIESNQSLDQVILQGSGFQHFASLSELQSHLGHYWPLWLNTARLKKRLQKIDFFQRKIVFPQFNGLSGEEQKKQLKEQVYRNVYYRYPEIENDLQEKIYERIEYELSIIFEKGFASYFLVVEDIVRQCPITCGRGSGAASIVSYLLFITHVDPIKHNLFFDRFLNPGREDPPDIDIDFPYDERSKVMDYVLHKYAGHAAMVCNQNFFQWKSAIREVAKVEGVPEDQISYVTKRLNRMELDKRWDKIIEIAKKIKGVMRHLSLHCGGMVITPRPIDEYVPVQLSPEGVPFIQWEKDQTEEAGLVKIDLLGNRSLAVIRDTLQVIKSHPTLPTVKKTQPHGEITSLTYSLLNPLQDQKAQQLLLEGETIGVFYIESPGTRQFLQKMQSGEYEHVVIASSIIRPAANRFANTFTRRLHGEAYTPLHPLVHEVLEETYGIMIYQEQVTQVAMKLADFSSYEGNVLRKILGKKHKEKKLRHLKDRFFIKALEKGISQQNLQELWEMILSFAGYSFCKPHSASYALVSYKSLYLKAHHPAEFMAAVISHRGGFYSTQAYLDECRRMNLTILPPCINQSDYDFKGSEGSIRTGFSQVKHLTNKAVQAILEERKNSRFKNFSDFLSRVCISFEEVKILIKSRVFHSLISHQDTIKIMWEAYYFFAAKKGIIAEEEKNEFRNYQLNTYERMRYLEWENTYLQGQVTYPYWVLFKKFLQKKNRVQGINIPHFAGKHVQLFGIKVTSKRVRTKNNEEMMFVSFSDETSIYETVFFPGFYEAFADVLFLGGAFEMIGFVDNDHGAVSCHIQDLRKVEDVFA